MIAISVKQPWANLIAIGEKSIETRLWASPFRGELLIVSSQRPPVFPAGCAVAVAQLFDCRPMTLADQRRARCAVYEGAVAWDLRNIRPVRPVPVRGALRLFEAELPNALEIITVSEFEKIVRNHMADGGSG